MDAAIRTQIKTCALFVPIISSHSRARIEGYFRLEWKLAVDRSHLMAAERPFLVPVLIDETKEADARVPDRFRDIQWTRLPNGETTPEFVARIRRLLGPVGADVGPGATPHALSHGRAATVRRRSIPLIGVSVLLIGALAYIGVSRRFAQSPSRPWPCPVGRPDGSPFDGP